MKSFSDMSDVEKAAYRADVAREVQEANARLERERSVGAERIAAERRRQITAEGWTPEHDDEHTDGSLQVAAWAYLTESGAFGGEHGDDSPEGWPWEREAWKPSDDLVRNLVKAGALIAAEIDRLQRVGAAT